MTITRTGNPGRMVKVGWMLSWRWTICCPVWLMLLEAPLRIACTRPFSSWLVPASAPTLSWVETTAALNSIAPVVVDLVIEPGIPLYVGDATGDKLSRWATRWDEMLSKVVAQSGTASNFRTANAHAATTSAAKPLPAYAARVSTPAS